MVEMGDQPGQGQLIVHGEAGPRRKKMINLLNRSPSPVILEDYGELEPSKCTVGGPGIAGGIVGVSTQVTVTARDASHVRIREGGHSFVLELKHTGKGNETRKYESVDHGDGHYSFSGVRADLKGMHQLSVEVNGTLVGDSPYLVMFEIDDDAELTTENADGTIPVARKSAATSIKERIVFVQRMNPMMTSDGMTDIFAKFGRVMKCEKMLPSHDIWMIQFSRPEDASEAVTVNGSDIMGCQVNVALASTLGGVGTHPIVMHQLQHIQAMHFQEQQSTSWATQLAAQRASIRQAGGEVEELTDTRKRRKALALMARLQAKVEQAKVGSGGAGGVTGEGSPAGGTPVGTSGADAGEDLRHRPQAHRSKSRDRERSGGRDDRGRGERDERGRSERGRVDRDVDRRSADKDRDRRTREDERDRRDRAYDSRSRDRGRGDTEYDRRDGDRRQDWDRDKRGRDRRPDDRGQDDRSHGRERDRPDNRAEHRSESRRRVEPGSDRRGDDRRAVDRDRSHRRSRERDMPSREHESHRTKEGRSGDRSRRRDTDRPRKERKGDDDGRREKRSEGAATAEPVRNGRGRSRTPE